MSGRLQAWLRREGATVIAGATLQAAIDRQSIYGGGLETAILERRGMSEPALWARLAAVTGLPAPAPRMCDGSAPVWPPALPAAVTAPLRTVPVGQEGDTLELLCAEPVATDAICAMVAQHGLRARLFVVPETRLFAMRQRIYGEPLPARHAALLAAVLGAARARTAFLPGPAAPREGERSAVRPPGARAIQPPPPPPPAPPGRSRGHAADSPAGEGAPTPLEHFLDLSGPFSGAEPEFDAEVEAEMQLALEGAVRVIGAAEGEDANTIGSPPAAKAGTAGASPVSPVRLEVLSSAPAQAAPTESTFIEGSGDFATEALCRRARDPADKGRLLALRALRQRWTHAATQALLRELRAEAAAEPTKDDAAAIVAAIEALGELRDGTTIPLLIERLHPRGTAADEIVSVAHRTLVALCAQDFGRSQPRWQTWARAHGAQPRVEWLLDALAHKNAEIREAAVEDLRHLTGDSFGYLARSPKRERDRARRRFVAWWQGLSRPERPIYPVDAAAAEKEAVFLAPGEEVPLPPTPKAR